jgi:hypothetical protein
MKMEARENEDRGSFSEKDPLLTVRELEFQMQVSFLAMAFHIQWHQGSVV